MAGLLFFILELFLTALFLVLYSGIFLSITVRENEPGYKAAFHLNLSYMSYFVWEGGYNTLEDGSKIIGQVSH